MEQILDVIRERNNFVLAGHTSPDGDAVGSCFGLAMALEKMDKRVQVIMEPISQKLRIIPGRRFLFPGPLESLQAEVFIALDCADPERLGAARKVFGQAEITCCIDHHETNAGFAMHNYIEPLASSTSEMVFRLIERLTTPTVEIASAIYAGLVSDTGGFRYNATAKSTMETAARLMEMGIPFTEIYNELMHRHRFSAAKAMGLALENCAQSDCGRIVYTYATRDMLSAVGAMPADLDGVVEYLMGIRGAEVALLVYEQTTPFQVKVSLRSQGPNVGHVATAMGGGGHMLAAGASVTGSVANVMARALTIIEKELEAYARE